MFDSSMLDLMPDEITIEPFISFDVSQAPTYGAAVTYSAQVVAEWSKVISPNGRELESNVRVLIPERVHIDPRSRLTLPSGWVPRQPPILAVQPIGGVSWLALDYTEIRC